MKVAAKTLRTWIHYFHDEADAAKLYRVLAKVESDDDRSDLCGRLADVEVGHTDMWRKILAEHGHERHQGTLFRRRVGAKRNLYGAQDRQLLW